LVFTSHRIAYLIGYGEDPAPLWVLHRCDVKKCCNPVHLFAGTCADNVHDAISKGHMALTWEGNRNWVEKHPERLRMGEQLPYTKLKESQIVEMRKLYADGGWTHRALGEKFGMAKGTISHILTRRTWKHIVP
jgi:hypothetical protein